MLKPDPHPHLWCSVTAARDRAPRSSEMSVRPRKCYLPKLPYRKEKYLGRSLGVKVGKLSQERKGPESIASGKEEGGGGTREGQGPGRNQWGGHRHSGPGTSPVNEGKWCRSRCEQTKQKQGQEAESLRQPGMLGRQRERSVPAKAVTLGFQSGLSTPSRRRELGSPRGADCCVAPVGQSRPRPPLVG